ncbi:MAG: hypothetical protein N2C13_05405 [Chloroflexota bacterium]
MDTNNQIIIAFVVLVVIFRFIVPVLRKSDGSGFEPGKYSMAGGAVCPRCALPYSRKTLSPNLVLGKLERCPHCGKIAIVGRASAADLQAAEARLTSPSQDDVPQGEESRPDSLRQQLEDSRFED